MWLVKLALARPYTFIVISLLILVFGSWFSYQVPKDIFPNIDIPVVSVVWSYSGMTAKEFEERITSFSEFALSSTVNGIERIESQTYAGFALIRLYFYEDTKVDAAVAQVTATCQQILRRLPENITPPVILLYSPSSAPILQVMISSDTVPEEDLNDYASFRLRHLIAVIQGLTLPPPFGGKLRELMIDMNPDALQARGLSPRVVLEAVNRQNIIIPTGDAKIGNLDYFMNGNNTLLHADDYNHIPIAVKDGSIIYLSDVGFAHEGFPPQINIVHDNGRRAVLLSLIKNGSTSILDIIGKVKELLPKLREAAPPGINIDLRFDQSIFVKHAIVNIFREVVLASILTALLIYLFLRNWSDTIIVAISIPLSILASIILIHWMGYSLNLMTLGGLTLAIGILVDNASITVENIQRNFDLRKSPQKAVLDGSHEIALPSFVSSLAICIVFLPISLLVGASKFLFVPFAYAAVFAIAFSYFLARTLVPILIYYTHKNKSPKKRRHTFVSLQKHYAKTLFWSLKYRATLCLIFGLVVCTALLISPFIGSEFFPPSNTNLLRLHVKAPTGTRIEVTEEIFVDVEEEIQKIIPKNEIIAISDNIGLNPVPYTMAFGDQATKGTWDGEILIDLKPAKKHPTSYYKKQLRTHLSARFPECSFYFQSADLTGQILNFGLPAPINVKISGYDHQKNLEVATDLIDKISRIPGAVDVHLGQDLDAPELFVNVNRVLTSKVNLMQRDVATDLLITNSDSTVFSSNFWIDPKMELPYLIAIQTPKYRVDSMESLLRTPISNPLTKTSELLGNLATIERRKIPAVVNHYDIQPTYDIYANVQDIDLGTVAGQIQKLIPEAQAKLSPGNEIRLSGLVKNMQDDFKNLSYGMIAAMILIYFMLVINFQSWLDPFIIMLTPFGALVGIIWALFLTHTAFSIPSLMGAIVVIGLATANSILLVSFANELMHRGKSSIQAAYEAGRLRMRPILITASAMILGMIPMALGIGSGAEQQAPLGRAVIGGLIFATFSTLFFVPVIFSYLRKKPNKYLEPK